MVDGDVVGSDPVLEAAEGVLEGDVAGSAVGKVLARCMCIAAGDIDKDKEAQRT